MSDEDTRGLYRVRVRVFVDFWNFQLTINRLAPGFKIDWYRMGAVVAEESLKVVDPTASLSYQGMNVYGSHDPNSIKDQALRHWAMNVLNKFPGVHVTMLERQRRLRRPACPVCLHEVTSCPRCQSDMRGTEEKGVDTRIATDMISLAWTDNYDVAVLVSSDRDFIPVVDFLSTKGVKVIHGAFPPQGAALTQASWANIDMRRLLDSIRRF